MALLAVGRRVAADGRLVGQPISDLAPMPHNSAVASFAMAGANIFRSTDPPFNLGRADGPLPPTAGRPVEWTKISLHQSAESINQEILD